MSYMLNARLILMSLLMLFSFNARANCNTTEISNYLSAKKINSIEITTNNSRKWAKNYIKAVRSSKETSEIFKKYKKKFKAEITVLFDNNLSCTFSAKIRISGDYSDHLASIPPITSLDVKLLEGNINSIVKFKLFIPGTRGGDNEIFVTSLFKELGFLAPKTYNVPAIFNGVKTTFLFQEKITKEFLESNYLREAPILRGNERYIREHADGSFSLVRMANKKWANKGTASLSISKAALTQINKPFLKNLLEEYVYKNPSYVGRPLKVNASNEGAISREREFKAIMLATGSSHGLSADDMRYYYDPMYQYFNPIYYDGVPEILNIDKVLLNNNPPSIDEVIGTKSAIASLNNLNRLHFKEELEFLGLYYDLKKISVIVNEIIFNLETLTTYPLSKVEELPYVPYFSNYKEYKGDKKLVFIALGKFSIEVCNFTLTNCNFEILNLEEYSDLLGGGYNNSYIFVGDKEGYISNLDKQRRGEVTKFNLGNEVELFVYGTSEILLDRKNKKINLHQNSVKDRFLLKGGRLKDWTVEFIGLKKGLSAYNEQRFNQDLLTGCLTFLDMQVDNVNVNINGSLCEDGVNFIRVNGNLNNIEIKDASSDAIDVDFSKLYFNNIKIYGAENDCIDLSSGVYHIKNSELNKCKDKAISVGEKANLIVDFVQILESDIGIAAKDSSVVEVGDLNADNVATCFSAYRKKQEFWGGKITVNKHNCQPSQMFQQKGSLIKFIQ
jgi:hypothetical protein